VLADRWRTRSIRALSKGGLVDGTISRRPVLEVTIAVAAV
jgi:hypothetical protein